MDYKITQIKSNDYIIFCIDLAKKSLIANQFALKKNRNSTYLNYFFIGDFYYLFYSNSNLIFSYEFFNASLI